MHDIKYIRTKCGKIILFSTPMEHAEFREWNPVSAGFCSIGVENGRLSVSVEERGSVTLGIGPKDDDEKAILAFLKRCPIFLV